MLHYQILVSAIHKKIKKGFKKIMNLKYQLNYLIDHSLYQILKNILSTSSKNIKS